MVIHHHEIVFCRFAKEIIYIYIGWVVPLPSNSHHQDYYILSRKSQPKPITPSFATGILGGRQPNTKDYTGQCCTLFVNCFQQEPTGMDSVCQASQPSQQHSPPMMPQQACDTSTKNPLVNVHVYII